MTTPHDAMKFDAAPGVIRMGNASNVLFVENLPAEAFFFCAENLDFMGVLWDFMKFNGI